MQIIFLKKKVIILPRGDMGSRQVAIAKSLEKRKSKNWARESTGGLSIDNNVRK